MDILCKQWAVTRRKINGTILGEKLEPKERLGKLNCVLGVIKDDAEGASQSRGVTDTGHYPQNFPEVYTGITLLVHRGFTSMCGEWRLVMNAHYVERERTVKQKAAEIGCSIDQYWDRLRMLKAYLSGYIGRQSVEDFEATKNTSELQAFPLRQAASQR